MSRMIQGVPALPMLAANRETPIERTIAGRPCQEGRDAERPRGPDDQHTINIRRRTCQAQPIQNRTEFGKTSKVIEETA